MVLANSPLVFSNTLQEVFLMKSYKRIIAMKSKNYFQVYCVIIFFHSVELCLVNQKFFNWCKLSQDMVFSSDTRANDCQSTVFICVLCLKMLMGNGLSTKLERTPRSNFVKTVKMLYKTDI